MELNLHEDLKYTSTAFYGYKLDLMSKKGIYPYDFMDSMEKFEIKELPKIKDFYSTLNEEHISEKDYNHAKEVWNAFRIKNMGEYHDLYLQSDVLLLTDVFENFRNTCMQYNGSLSLLHEPWFKLGSYAKNDQCEIRVNDCYKHVPIH